MPANDFMLACHPRDVRTIEVEAPKKMSRGEAMEAGAVRGFVLADAKKGDNVALCVGASLVSMDRKVLSANRKNALTAGQELSWVGTKAQLAGGASAAAAPQKLTPTQTTLRVGTLNSDITSSTPSTTIPMGTLGNGDLLSKLNTTAETFSLKAGSYLAVAQLTHVATMPSGSNALANRATLAFSLDGTLGAGSHVTIVPNYFRGAVSLAPEQSAVECLIHLASDTDNLRFQLAPYEGIGGSFNKGWEARVAEIVLFPLSAPVATSAKLGLVHHDSAPTERVFLLFGVYA